MIWRMTSWAISCFFTTGVRSCFFTRTEWNRLVRRSTGRCNALVGGLHGLLNVSQSELGGLEGAGNGVGFVAGLHEGGLGERDGVLPLRELTAEVGFAGDQV